MTVFRKQLLSSAHIYAFRNRKEYSAINSRAIRQAGHVKCVERREVHEEFWLGNLKERDQMENLDVDGIIILKYITEEGEKCVD